MLKFFASLLESSFGAAFLALLYEVGLFILAPLSSISAHQKAPLCNPEPCSRTIIAFAGAFTGFHKIINLVTYFVFVINFSQKSMAKVFFSSTSFQ